MPDTDLRATPMLVNVMEDASTSPACVGNDGCWVTRNATPPTGSSGPDADAQSNVTAALGVLDANATGRVMVVCDDRRHPYVPGVNSTVSRTHSDAPAATCA